jgi:prepilin-type N-terminal cleavage/methylation domain-containing protein
MIRRNGFSLVEVLVAMFIMGLGVISILTLFPLGAANMANAVREERSAQLAASADGYLRAYWKTRIIEPILESQSIIEPFFLALTNPDPLNQKGLPALALPTEASYPVFVDPMGFVARSGLGQAWVGDGGTTNIPRRNIEALKIGGSFDNELIFRVCSQWDGIGWDDDSQTITKDREVRYNWLAVLQRPASAPTTNANLTIVVFDRRVPLSAKTGDEVVFPGVQFTPLTTSVRLLNANPDLKPGQWILDASVNLPNRPGIRHANFYRVVSVTYDPNNNWTDLELQTPINLPTDGNSSSYTGTLVILRGVSGVYTRRMLAPEN